MLTSAINNENANAIQLIKEGVAISDRSHWGRIRVSGDDRIRFLHNQSTNNFQVLKPGQGCDTVMVTSTARTIDLVTSYVLDDAVLLLVSPNRRQLLAKWLDRYIFFADKVKLTDITAETATFSLMGPQSHGIVEKLGAGDLIGQPDGNLISVNGVIVAIGSGLATPGYTLILPVTNKETLWNKILSYGAGEVSDQQWEMLRILQGRPAPGAEITDDYNPLEVGLWQTISLNKGCYIGQETIARLNTYKGVKQYLWGIHLHNAAEPGTIITIGDEKVGKLTSYTTTPDGHFGLGYIRSKAGGVGLKVQIGETEGEIVAIPFVSHEYPLNKE
ncbi:YgfZ/GcvT domain-containing protein [Dolichospermum circinale]|uniref:CAF17-like 4Fe-4S cluster assembly/insertion protein YgfZ n=1 Tax=Dolichospermum circinale TaxID=109265 RepID=UPI00232F8862|nr:folate-binding protein [Dolichospermum circinale]MDB9466909.1 folate-binding protein [Dolichospermum circinale CS-539/09]MDB9472139.1 folate-binding protein [Dolichospermum circinale CS-539]